MIQLRQSDYDHLIQLEKHLKDGCIAIPSSGKKSYDVISSGNKEIFFLDINKSGIIELRKATLQTRYTTISLVRLDIDSPPHINPDGSKTSRNHIHYYREGYGDAWAEDLPTETQKLSTFEEYLSWFLKKCNIEEPAIQTSLL